MVVTMEGSDGAEVVRIASRCAVINRSDAVESVRVDVGSYGGARMHGVAAGICVG